MTSKMQVEVQQGAAHPKARGTLACSKHRSRGKPEEVGLSQADPSAARAPSGRRGRCPVGKGSHGRTVSGEWTERMCFERFSLAPLANRLAGDYGGRGKGERRDTGEQI